MLAAGALTASPARADQGFAGRWVATDGDGSNLVLSIHGDAGRYAVREVDDAASVCGGAPAAVNGSGVAQGETLEVAATLVCLPRGNVFRHRLQLSFVLDTSTDTLMDNDGVTWQRTG
jgi:hypothetical protein